MGLIESLGFCSKNMPPDASENNRLLDAHELHHKNKQKQAAAREAYERNYKHLYQQMRGQWCYVLQEMGQNAMGQTILANLPPDLKVRIEKGKDENGNAYYSFEENELTLLYFDNDEQEDFIFARRYRALVHESRHAMQDYLGYNIVKNVGSVSQTALLYMLMEADAHAVADAEALIFACFAKTNPTQKQIQNFMKRDIVAETIKANNLKKKDIPMIKRELQKSSPAYMLQQALKKAGGNIEKAKQLLRGDFFKQYWNQGALGEHYETQTLNLLLDALKNGETFSHDNSAQVEKIYAEIAKTHGLKVSDLKKKPLFSEAFYACIDYMEKNPHLSPRKLKTAFEQIYQNSTRGFCLNPTASMLRAGALLGPERQ